MDWGLDGKTIVGGGGAPGSGLEIRQRLAREGACTVVSVALIQHARDRRFLDPARKGDLDTAPLGSYEASSGIWRGAPCGDGGKVLLRFENAVLARCMQMMSSPRVATQ